MATNKDSVRQRAKRVHARKGGTGNPTPSDYRVAKAMGPRGDRNKSSKWGRTSKSGHRKKT